MNCFLRFTGCKRLVPASSNYLAGYGGGGGGGDGGGGTPAGVSYRRLIRERVGLSRDEGNFEMSFLRSARPCDSNFQADGFRAWCFLFGEGQSGVSYDLGAAGVRIFCDESFLSRILFEC